MSRAYGPVIHCNLTDEGAMTPNMQDATLTIAVRIGYPGSKVSDVWIGGTMVQVSNEHLRQASLDHDELCDTEGG